MTHRPGAHDDLANATTGVLVLVAESIRKKAEIWVPNVEEPRATPVGPEHQQLLDRLPPRLFEKPTGEFTCGNCQFFAEESNRCQLRKFGTLAHFIACEAYDARRLGPLVTTRS